MREVGTLEAQNSLSALIELVEKGEEITITRYGKPVAHLLPPTRKSRGVSAAPHPPFGHLLPVNGEKGGGAAGSRRSGKVCRGLVKAVVWHPLLPARGEKVPRRGG
ncbi:type II toxin-antitoxin system Phd/YefM family antitoxin [Aquibium pacificus]|uniref:type II toxin-antitoxin system Phd/YefM family antitoxin n=1 Tax=Aquibium pacificus TaxID=3153579 RepID=UPI00349F748A